MLKKILKYLLLAALFTPLIRFSNTVFPFVFGKAIFFQLIVSASLAVYVFLLAKKEIGWPKRSRLFQGILLFLAVITIASLFGVDFWHSFWDMQERMTGIFNLLYYAAFFMMLVSVFDTPTAARQLAFVAWLAGILLMLSGYVQLINPEIWGYLAASRIAGLLNNPIFYAMAMVFLIFLSLFLAVSAENKKQKVLFFAVSGLAFYAVFLSQTRGSVIGAVGGFLLYGLGEVLIMKDPKKRKIILATIGAGVVILASLWFFKDTPIINQSPVGYYLNISPFASTGVTRLLAWKAAYQGFLERPVFGWGLNNFNIIFNKFYDPASLRYTAYETWFDRTHNVTLEFLSTTGVVGLLAYLGIFVVAFLILIKVLRRPADNQRPLLFLGAGLVAYFIQNQFALDQPTSLLWFFLFLAIINIYGEPSDRLVVPEKCRVARPWIVLAIMLASSYAFNVVPLYAGYLDVVGAATAEKDYNFSKLQLQKALDLNHPYRFDSVIEFTEGAIRASVAGTIVGQSRTADFSEAEQQLKNLIAEHPAQTYYWYLLGRLYSEWGRSEGKYFSLAESAFREARKLSPRRQQIFYGLGQMNLFAKKYDQAEQIFRQMVDLEPRVGESHWYLGLALFQRDKTQETLAEMEQAYKFNYVPQSLGELGFFVKLFEAEKRYEKIAIVYERYIGGHEPVSGELYAKASAAWLAAGNFSRARQFLGIAISRDPSLKAEAAIFSKMIDDAEKKQVK